MIDVSSPIIEIPFDYNKGNVEDIQRCLQTLYSTPIGTVALERDFGMDWHMVDKPIPTAKILYTNEVIQKTMKYEPRVRVKEVEFLTESLTGKLIPKVIVEYSDNL